MSGLREKGGRGAGRRTVEAGEGGTPDGGSMVLLQSTSSQSQHRTGRVPAKLGRGLGSHLGTRQTSFTRATSFTRRAFGASGARRTTFTSGTLVWRGGITGTIRVSGLGLLPRGQHLLPPREVGGLEGHCWR